MHIADLRHDDKTLQAKLEHIFQLRRTKTAINWDQSMFIDLLQAFGNPQNHLPPVIHVAGTNGKGSTVALFRSVFEAAGMKVHAYTSPHLVNVNERIYLAGQNISNAELEALIDEALSYIDNAPLSFFEIMTAVAFKAFSQAPADVLLLEVGMGGRLDCTNVVQEPILSIINRISFDHTQFLGEGIRDIAAEKAGIIKQGVPCIVGYQGDGKVGADIIDVLQNAAQQKSAPLFICNEQWSAHEEDGHLLFDMNGRSNDYALPALAGGHQILNAGLVLAGLEIIKGHFNISDAQINDGFQSVTWPGRLQRLDDVWPAEVQGNEIWLDAGHNDSAAEALQKQMIDWEECDAKPVHLIVGMLTMKSPEPYLSPLLGHVEHLHIVPISSDPNSHTKETLIQFVDPQKINASNIHQHDSVIDAVSAVLSQYKDARIIISGSVYLAGEVLGFVHGAE